MEEQAMQVVIWRGLFWLVTEVFFTLAGLDNLADYSEFIFRFKDNLDLQRQRVERLMGAPDQTINACCLALEPAPVTWVN
jgi:hypothetical protein